MLGSAVILRKTFKLMDTNEKESNSQKNINWSLGQAFGLASLWTAKLLAACFLLYWAQKEGFSLQGLGIGIPTGIIVGALIMRKKV